MNNTSRITILIALYKAGEFIKSKLESLKNQTIIDNSTIVFLNCQNRDNETVLCEEFASTRPNVINIVFDKYISLYDSWNIGITKTNSEYIVNYNADDQWHPSYLEKCCDYLDLNQDIAIVSTGVLITNIPNQIWPNWIYHDKIPSHPYPLSTAGPCPVWRRKLHEKYGLFGSYHVIGDARMWEKFHSGGEKFGVINEDLALYYCSQESLERRRDNITGQLLRDIDLETKFD